MKILVAVKQVPDSPEGMVLDERTGALAYPASTEFRMNRWDEYAVEEALRIRERQPGTQVHAISAGPERVTSTLRRAMGIGADHGIHLVSGSDEWLRPLAVASRIAGYAGGQGYDLILTGMMAEDDMAGQVGPQVAELLGIACSTSIIALSLSSNGRRVEVERETEGGVREVLALRLPAVLTIQSGINRPRYPSLSNVLRAHRQEIEVVPTAAIPTVSGREETLGYSYPEKSRSGVLLSGSARQKAEALVKLLREKSLLSP